MGPGVRRRQAIGLVAWAFFAFAALPGAAQETATALLTLDQERFFQESAFGRAAADRERLAAQALEDENKRIEAELVAEELALTELRGTLTAKEFTAKAREFDAKVESIRESQDAKVKALSAAREKDRQEFLRSAVPVLIKLLADRKAVAIVDKSQVILSLSAIDVTDAAIMGLDAAMAEGNAPGDAPTAAPQEPESAP